MDIVYKVSSGSSPSQVRDLALPPPQDLMTQSARAEHPTEFPASTLGEVIQPECIEQPSRQIVCTAYGVDR